MLCRRLGRDLGGEIIEIDGHHDVMLPRPAELVRRLAECPRLATPRA
jgi:hypothetical protein